MAFQSSPDFSPIEPSAVVNPVSESVSHPTLWYDDGSVVLQVETTMFRVHRSILSAQSEIFKDMFAIPQSPTGSDSTIDGCPVVTMMGDTTQDWENALLAVYDLCYFDNLSQTICSDHGIQCAAGILRLSTKYHIRTLRAKSSAMLEMLCPCNLDKMVARGSAKIDRTIRLNHSLIITALAVECHVPTLLPAALYQLCMALPSSGAYDDRLLEEPTIPDKLKAQFFSGRSRIYYGERQEPSTSFEDETMEPLLGNDIFYRKCNGARSTSCSVPRFSLPNDRIFSLSTDYQQARVKEPGPGSWCFKCLSKKEKEFCSRQRAIWDKLPSYFSLGSWEDLQRERDEYGG